MTRLKEDGIHTGDDDRTDAITDIATAFDTLEEALKEIKKDGDYLVHEDLLTVIADARKALDTVDKVVLRVVQNACLANSEDDEPIFVLVARDKFAPETIRKWVELVCWKGGLPEDSEKVADALQIAANMETWAKNNRDGGKVPD